MASYKCPICKNTGYSQEDIKEEKQTLDVKEEDLDIEYDSESEHEWDSDDPDNSEVSVVNHVSVKIKAEAPEENNLKEPKVKTNIKEDRVNEQSEIVERGSEESRMRVPRLAKNRYQYQHRDLSDTYNLTKVKMPSGLEVNITSHTSYGWKCGRESNLITLHRHGRTSRREYNIVVDEMEKTKIDIDDCINRGGCLKSFNVLKITKIDNGCLWRRYKTRQEEIKLEGSVNERMLFHGTKKVREIAQTGFDERFSRPSGVFGAGVYFTENSSAADEYTYGLLGGTGCPKHQDKRCTTCVRRMFLSRVTLGKTHDNGTSGKNFAHAPVGFHSVMGKNGPKNYMEYMVYRGEQAYPEYLISYTINI